MSRPKGEYVWPEDFKKYGVFIEHLNGVPWPEAPKPRRWHRCWAQTRGMGYERCACGATRNAGYHWYGKNERSR